MPNHFVVFDRVRSTDPGFSKQWLLHTAHEPAIDGTTLRADHLQGRMFCRTLLPKDARLELVGGPGKEFWAAGRNWEINTKGLTPEHLAMMGQWRLEVSPGEPRTDDLFLHVIQVGDQTLESMNGVELLETDGTVGARVHKDQGTWEVTFAATGDLAGHVRFAGEGASIDQPLAQTVTAQDTMPPAPYAYRQLDDPAQEARAQALMETLRCLKCQSQSIADSDAPMAGDMRSQVRQRIAAGEDRRP
jgi:hypothetical protein